MITHFYKVVNKKLVCAEERENNSFVRFSQLQILQETMYCQNRECIIAVFEHISALICDTSIKSVQ